MPIHAKTNRPRATREFTDRLEFMAAFNAARAEMAETEFRVLVYYGIGGIGKTTLRKELGRQLDALPDPPVWTALDFDLPPFRDQETAVFTLRNALAHKFCIPFPTFDLAYAVYWQKTHPQTPLNKDTFPLLEDGNIVGEIMGALGVVPVLGLIPKVGALLLHSAGAFKEWWTRRGSQDLLDLPSMEPKDILDRLGYFWANDLRDFLAKKKQSAIFFLDTYEAIWDQAHVGVKDLKRDAWIRELIAMTPNALWVICGREKLQWEEVDADWADVLRQHLVGRLAAEDIDRFLVTAGIDDPPTRQVIIQGSKGVPYYLDLAVDTYTVIQERHSRNPMAADFASLQLDILERFLRYLDRTEIETLKLLSIPRFWDDSIFTALVLEFHTGYPTTAFEDLCRFSFIHPGTLPGTWQMQDLMREALQGRLSAPVLERVQHLLFQHYEAHLAKLDAQFPHPHAAVNLNEAFHHGSQVLDHVGTSEWLAGRVNYFRDTHQWDILIPILESLLWRFETELLPGHAEARRWRSTLASILQNKGRYQEAENYHRRSLELAESADPVNLKHLVESLQGLGLQMIVQGNYSEAERLFLRSLAALDANEDPNDLGKAAIMDRLGQLYLEMGRYPEAERNLLGSLAIQEEHPDSEAANTVSVWNNLGRLYQNEARYEEAEVYFLKAERVLRQEPNPSLAPLLNNLAELYRSQFLYDKAEPLFQESLKILEHYHSPDHPMTAGSRNNLALIYEIRGDFDKAESYYRRSLEILENSVGAENPLVAYVLTNMGMLKVRKGNWDEAQGLLERALRIRELKVGWWHPQTAKTLACLAILNNRRGDLARAFELNQQVLAIQEKVLGPDHPDTVLTRQDYEEYRQRIDALPCPSNPSTE